MIRGFHHVAVATLDLERLLPFYRDVLHCEVVADWGWPQGTQAADDITGLTGSAARSVMLRTGNAYVELFQYSEPQPGEGDPHRRVCDPGLTHLCFDVTDVDAEYSRLRAAGMTFHSEPRDVAPGVRTTYGRDPDGNVVEIQQVEPGRRIALAPAIVAAIGDSRAGGGTVETLDLAVGTHRHRALAAGPADGPLVLLLHGWPEFADSWMAELSELGRAGYRAVAVDQRGFSPAARPTAVEDYAPDHLVRDVSGFADALGAERFHLVGHDWGGLVAWSFASAHPERLRSLGILAAPHPGALGEAIRDIPDQHDRLDYVRLFRAADRTAEKALLADGAKRLRAAYGGHVQSEQVEANVTRLVEPGALTATLNWYRAVDDDLTVTCGRITVPTLYIWGSQDAALGPQAAHSSGLWVDAEYRFAVLPGGSHWLPEESPETVVPLLLEHLARNTGPGHCSPTTGTRF